MTDGREQTTGAALPEPPARVPGETDALWLQFSEDVVRAVTVADVAQSLLVLARTFGSDYARVDRVVGENRTLKTVGSFGQGPSPDYESDRDDEANPAHDALCSGKTLLVASGDEAARSYPSFVAHLNPSTCGALLALPAQVSGQTVAVLTMVFGIDCEFTAVDLQRLESAARLAAVALKRVGDGETLRNEFDRFSAMVESIPSLMWTTDADGVPDYLNRQWISYTGCDLESTRQLGWDGLLLPDDRETAREAWTASVRSGKPYQTEYRLRGADGSFGWFLARGLPIHDEAGRIVRWFGECTDISELVRNRQALRESEERFKTLFNDSRDAIGVASMGKILYVNNAFAKMLGFDNADELVGLATMDVVAEWDRPRLAALARSRAAGDKVPNVYEYRARRKDGTEADVENRVSVIRQEGSELTLVIARDVTARNKRLRSERFMAQATALLGSSLDYETTLRNVAKLAVPQLADWCVIHLTDDSGKLVQVAAAHVDPEKSEMARTMGPKYPPVRQESAGLYHVLETGKSELMNDIPDHLIRASAQSEEHLELLLSAGMRSYLCVALSTRGCPLGTITFLGAETGHRYGPEDVALAEELARHAAFAVDHARLYNAAQIEVTERRRAETLIAARQAEVETLNVRLRQAMVETHHRVKNHLQVISAMLELSLSGSGQEISRAEFERLSLHVRTLAALHDLLTTKAKNDAIARDISSRDILERVVEMNMVSEMGRALEVQLDDVELPIRHATGLALILSELLMNSLKYGQGTVSAEFTVTDQARLVVRDEGPGFPEGFDLAASRSTGLEIIDTIARWDLSGKIEIGSAPGGGAEVIVTFPWPASE